MLPVDTLWRVMQVGWSSGESRAIQSMLQKEEERKEDSKGFRPLL